jgi:hypothetical protein
MKRKRALLLVPAVVGLFLVAVAEHGDPAISKSMARIVAALSDPLSLFAARSPGGRDAGALLSTKPERSAGNPRERVLSTERERQPPLGLVPEVDSPPVTPEDFAAAPASLADADQAFGAPPSTFFRPGFGGIPQIQVAGSPPLGPSFPPAGPGDSEVQQGPGSRPSPPTLILPLPPGDTLPPEAGPPDSGPPDSGPIIIPEPATWAMMILGFLAIAVRRRVRKQTALTAVR